MIKEPKIFCAIDTADMSRAIELAKIIGPVTKGLKLGLEFFSTFGPQGVERIREASPDAALFLDLKFHDIPNTVAATVKSLSRSIKPAYLNVHASGGGEMMKAAKEACHEETKLLAVTILTSLSQTDLDRLNISVNMTQQVQHLAENSKQAGLDGVVCSSHEISVLRKVLNKEFILMVPGIRPAGTDNADQHRVMTPKDALQKGATHLVIGRPITGAPDPAEAAQKILGTLE